jgi:hypothetical protein
VERLRERYQLLKQGHIDLYATRVDTYRSHLARSESALADVIRRLTARSKFPLIERLKDILKMNLNE